MDAGRRLIRIVLAHTLLASCCAGTCPPMDVASGCTERILELRPCGYHAGYTRNVTSGNCSMERGMFRAVRLLDKRSNPRNAIFIDPADFKDYIIRCRYMRDITVKVTSDVTPKDVDMTIITPMASSACFVETFHCVGGGRKCCAGYCNSVTSEVSSLLTATASTLMHGSTLPTKTVAIVVGVVISVGMLLGLGFLAMHRCKPGQQGDADIADDVIDAALTARRSVTEITMVSFANGFDVGMDMSALDVSQKPATPDVLQRRTSFNACVAGAKLTAQGVPPPPMLDTSLGLRHSPTDCSDMQLLDTPLTDASSAAAAVIILEDSSTPTVSIGDTGTNLPGEEQLSEPSDTREAARPGDTSGRMLSVQVPHASLGADEPPPTGTPSPRTPYGQPEKSDAVHDAQLVVTTPGNFYALRGSMQAQEQGSRQSLSRFNEDLMDTRRAPQSPH